MVINHNSSVYVERAQQKQNNGTKKMCMTHNTIRTLRQQQQQAATRIRTKTMSTTTPMRRFLQKLPFCLSHRLVDRWKTARIRTKIFQNIDWALYSIVEAEPYRTY